ncbi:hypothetical protein VaNZ11_007710 [Volvox africanus]|uniref:AMP-dependent synthetase/ligase domain-containing protein n=1 Tax=Volvox africanus TaxID=51714 RepID=A0ABQ5S3F2_9CHLO|nr:hypothetical protein VaNZ11_007710 [Volvox africanus]
MTLCHGASEIWRKARAVLLSPEAAAAAVFDASTGVRLPFSDLAQQVLHLQALIQSWLENASDTGTRKAPSLAEAVLRHHSPGPLEIPDPPSSSEACEFNGITMQEANEGGDGEGRVGCLSGMSVASSVPALVAVFSHASLDYIRMVLAVMASGAAFLPLDPSWPPSRIAAVVFLARPALLLTNTANQHLLPPELLYSPYRVCVVPPPPQPPQPMPPLRHQLQDQDQERQNLSPTFTKRCEDSSTATTTDGDEGSGVRRRRCAVQGQDLPYFAVLYTSGSTGEPLGVCMCESAWLKRIAWMQRRYPLRPPGTLPSPPAMPQLSSTPYQQPGTLESGGVSSPGDTGPQVAIKSGPSKLDNRVSVGQDECAGDDDNGGVDDSYGGSGPGSVVCFSTAVSFVDHLWQLLAPILAPSCEVEGGSVLDREAFPAATVRAQHGAPAAAPGPAVAPTAEAVRPAGPCSVLIPPPGAVLQPELFVGLLADHGVSHLVSVPSLLRHLLPALRAGRHRLSRLRLLVSSGEPLAVDLAAELSKGLPDGARLLNLYGCTEVTADCTWFEVECGAAEAGPGVLQATGKAGGRKGLQQVGKEALDRDTDEGAADTAGSGGGAAAAASQSTSGGEWVVERAGASAAASAWVPAGWPINDTQILIAPPQDDMDSDTSLDDEAGGSGGGDAGKEGPDGTGLVPTAGNGVVTAAAVTPLPLGSVGEVWVGGSCLSAGYYIPPASAGVCDGDGDTNARPEGDAGPARVDQVIEKGACAHWPVPTNRFRRLRLTADQATRVATADGLTPFRDTTYFRTGDLGRLSSSGYLQLLGRVDRQIKVAGVRLDLGEVEALLASHPLVHEVAVVRWAQAMTQVSRRALDHHGGSGIPLVDAALAAAEVTAMEEFEGMDLGNKQVERDPREAGEAGMKGTKLFPIRSQQLEPPARANESPELLAYLVLAPPPENVAVAAAASAGASASGSITSDSYLPAPVSEAVAAGLRNWLSQHLALRGGLRLHFLSLTQLPRNPAGKLMRRQLPRPPPLMSRQPAPEEHWGLRPPDTQLQLNATSRHQRQPPSIGVDPFSEMAVMWAIVTATGLTGLEATTDMFSAGMSSLEAVQVAALLCTDVRLVLSYRTPRTLAAALRAAVGNAGSSRAGSSSANGADDSVVSGRGAGSAGPPAKRPRLERTCLQALTAPLVPSALPKPFSAASMNKSVVGSPGGSFAAAEVALRTHETNAPGGDTSVAAILSADATGILGGDGQADSRFKDAVRACRKLRWQRGGDGGGGGDCGHGRDEAIDDESNAGGEGGFHAAAGVTEEEEEAEDNTTVPAVPISEARSDRGGLWGRWRYRLGRCVDAPVLHVSLDSDFAPDLCQKHDCHKKISKRESDRHNHHHQQQQPAAASGPAAPRLGLARGSNLSRCCVRAIVACSHDGDVACLDEATGVPYWQVRLPARVEAGLAIAWGSNRGGGCGDTGVDARLITSSAFSTVLDVAAVGGTAILSVSPAGEAAVGIKAGQDAYTRRDDGGHVRFATDCITDPDTRRHSSDTVRAPLPQQQPYMIPYVIAACGNGVLYSLDLADGFERGSVDCGGEFKSPPVCDPWVGAIWATGHSRQLVVMRPPDLELGRIPLGAAMSISAAFASIRQSPATHDGPKVATTLEPTSVQQDGTASPHGDATVTATPNRWQEPACGYLPIGHGGAIHHARQQRQQRQQREQCQQEKQQQEQLVRHSSAAPLLRMALIATLDGRTHAIRVDIIETRITSSQPPQPPQPLPPSPGPRGREHSGHISCPSGNNSTTPQGPLQLRLSRLWSLDGPAPVFSALLVLPGAPPLRDQRGQDPHMDGGATVIVGHVIGSVRAFQLESGLHPSDREAAPPSLRWGTQLQGNLFADLVFLPAPRTSHAGFILAATHAGLMYGMDAAYGNIIWTLDLASGPISAAPALVRIPTWFIPALAGPAAKASSRYLGKEEDGEACAIMAVCASNGTLCLVRLDCSTTGAGPASGGSGVGASMEATMVAQSHFPGEVFSSPVLLLRKPQLPVRDCPDTEPRSARQAAPLKPSPLQQPAPGHTSLLLGVQQYKHTAADTAVYPFPDTSVDAGCDEISGARGCGRMKFGNDEPGSTGGGCCGAVEKHTAITLSLFIGCRDDCVYAVDVEVDAAIRKRRGSGVCA